jgi:preprotein translocase subunit YajC
MRHNPALFSSATEFFVLDFLISPAFAQAASPTSPQSLLSAFWPLLVMIPLFYFLLIRPQSKRNKELRDMLAKIAKGDEVVTTGGLAGKVVGLGETFVTVEIADNVQVKVQKSAVTGVLPKGTLKAQ